MTICLCHGGMCELSIRCSWPPTPNDFLPWTPESVVCMSEVMTTRDSGTHGDITAGICAGGHAVPNAITGL